SIAPAQDRGASELKRRIFAQAASGVRAQAGDTIVQGEATPTVATQGAVGLAGLDKKRALLGTWNITLIFNDGGQGKSTLQVFPGRSDTDGSVIHASEFSLAPP